MNACAARSRTDVARTPESTGIWSEEAAHWWTLLHGEGATAADRREFLSWVSRSPERIEAYLGMERLMAALQSRDLRWTETPAEELIREAKAAAASPPVAATGRFRITPAEPRGSRRTALKWGLALGAVAACFAAAVVALRLPLLPAGSQRYATGFGEQRSILLADGSRVTLNSASGIEVDFGKLRRTIHLLHGEVLFQVSHDPARPFDVHAAGAVVRAIGTEFNVDLRSNYTAVTVLQGRVAVMNGAQASLPVASAGRPASGGPPSPGFPAPPGALLLGVAERVIITPAGMARPQRVDDLSAVTAWTHGQLVFENRPLGEVVDELNHSSAQRIVIRSSRLRERKVTGIIQLGDPDSLLSFLSDVPGVLIHKTRDGTTVVTLRGRTTDVGPGRGSSSATP
jgi:transmembrane sensor